MVDSHAEKPETLTQLCLKFTNKDKDKDEICKKRHQYKCHRKIKEHGYNKIWRKQSGCLKNKSEKPKKLVFRIKPYSNPTR